MRRLITALLAVGALLVGVGLVAPTTAAAQTVVVSRTCPFPGVPDRTVKVTWVRGSPAAVGYEQPTKVEFTDGGTFGASLAYALVTLDFTRVNKGIIRREQHNVPSTASNNAISWPWTGPAVQYGSDQLDMVVTVAGALGGGHCQVRVPDAW